MTTVFARAQERRETQTRATAGGREKVGRRSRRGGLVKKLNAGNDDESRMRATWSFIIRRAITRHLPKIHKSTRRQ